jgi:hypothetical protein
MANWGQLTSVLGIVAKLAQLDQVLYPSCGRTGVLVFPDPYYSPAIPAQHLIDLSISFDVSPELRQPIRAIALWEDLVSRAAVPEASVQEHGHTRPREYHVGTNPSLTRKDCKILAEPEATPVEAGTQAQLRFRVSPPVRLADPSGRCIFGDGVRHSDTPAECNGSGLRDRSESLLRPACCHTAWVY